MEKHSILLYLHIHTECKRCVDKYMHIAPKEIASLLRTLFKANKHHKNNTMLSCYNVDAVIGA